MNSPFSPEILEELREAYDKSDMPPAEEGWFMAKDLADQMGWSESKTRKIIADYVKAGRLEMRTNVRTSEHGTGTIYRFINKKDV